MLKKFLELWRPTGTIDRGTYALVGLIGFALKHNIDRMVAYFVFRHRWDVLNYWVPFSNVARITALSRVEIQLLATLLAIALPFIWLGVSLTMKRLRGAGLPLQLVIFFFVPFLNLFFFLLLSLIPDRASVPAEPNFPEKSFLARIVPENPLGSATASLLITVPIGLAMAVFGVRFMMHYGWGIFVAIPFAMGFGAAVIYGVNKPRSMAGCIRVACLSVLLLGLALLAFAVEGVVCLIMAVPIAVPLAALGGACGYLAQRRPSIETKAPVVLSILLLFVPAVQWMEHAAKPAPPMFVVHSGIDIKAPPETVWKQVIAFTEISPPKELMFRAGIAYPIRAQIFGTGPGAERHCVFSTGPFIEPIEVWDEPRLLKFSVTSVPAPMEEWTPYSHIDPPHLHGFLVSKAGQFLLTPLPNGGTHLEGTTWYQHGLWPSAYWRLWSDTIIHRIHMRVLAHIRDEAEHAEK
jgi:hypothetical protein